MGCSLLVLRTAPFLLVVCSVLAQQRESNDPQPARQRVVVREAGTGIALPGVPIHLGRAAREEPHLVDGWLRRFGRRPTAPRVVRSDPEGRLEFEAADGTAPLEMGPGFQLVKELQEDGVRVLLVQRCENRAVHVVDVDGKAVAGFAVFRKRTGETVVTDDFGVARFAPSGSLPHPAPRADEEGFLPAHWVGPADVRARVAGGGRENLWRMHLPPCVTFRLRFLRHGVPTPVPLDAAWLSAPVDYPLWGTRPEQDVPQSIRQLLQPVTCRGIEVGPVAWTGEVRGEVLLGRMHLPFVCSALPAKGTVLEMDLETDPPRPRLRCVVHTTDRPAPARVRVGARTDAGVFEDEVAVAADGRVLAGFDTARLRGTMVRRIWIDALGSAGGAAVTLDRDVLLQDVELELGEVTLVSHPPVLRGRVVDARGRPLPSAQVVVQGSTVAGSMLGVPVPVDAEGRFALVGPWFRDGNGEVGQATAVASLPRVHAGQVAPQPPPFRSPASAPKAPGGEVELVVSDAATGAVALVVRGAPPPWRSQLQVCLLDGNNQVLLHDARLLAPTDADAWHRGSIEAPIGRCRLQLRAIHHLLHELDIEIAPSRPDGPNAVQTYTVEFDALVRHRVVRAVDSAGREIPEARVYLRTAGHNSGVMPDERSELVWLEPRQLRHAAYLVAPGKQVIALPETASGDVTMVPAVPVTLRLQVGAGERLDGEWKVMLDPCEDTGMASYGTLAADGGVQCPGPTPGRYHVALFVRHDQFANRVRVGTVDVAEHKAVPDAIAIDATALAALRALQQEPPPRK
ncbi:MAG TPA: carboxypeptidase-like regulatory domain-containing protein [Planctomycetota bacterium]|nr:carboxypeptidase-like regulatory domain-containing protein [Planctomycetota bacterium]